MFTLPNIWVVGTRFPTARQWRNICRKDMLKKEKKNDSIYRSLLQPALVVFTKFSPQPQNKRNQTKIKIQTSIFVPPPPRSADQSWNPDPSERSYASRPGDRHDPSSHSPSSQRIGQRI